MGKCSPESEGLVVQGLLYRLCMGKKLLLENVTLFTVCSMYDHCKKTWVTLITLLGCLSYISVAKKCYQIGFLESSLRSFLFGYIS